MEKESTIVVPQTVETVWGIVSNPPKYHSLGLPHCYCEFQTPDGQPKPGAKFVLETLTNSPNGMKYVVECDQFKKLSFGDRPTEWQYSFQLVPNGAGTRVTFKRRFRTPSLLERMGSYSSDCQRLADKTTAKLNSGCERLATGQDDGIAES